MTTKPNDEGQSASTVEPTVKTVGLGTRKTAKAKSPGKSSTPAAKPRGTVKADKRAPTSLASTPEASATPASTPTPSPAKPTAPKKRKAKARGESATSPRRIAAVEVKQAQALEYRKMAYSYAQIAEALGYAGPQGAQAAVMSALARIVREPAQEVLKLELERLDGMFSKPYQAAINGDLMAVNTCLSIMARKAKFLGLDVAVKVDATVGNKDGTPFQTQVVTDAQVVDAVKKAADAF